jgi:hypothetical protein
MPLKQVKEKYPDFYNNHQKQLSQYNDQSILFLAGNKIKILVYVPN